MSTIDFTLAGVHYLLDIQGRFTQIGGENASGESHFMRTSWDMSMFVRCCPESVDSRSGLNDGNIDVILHYERDWSYVSDIIRRHGYIIAIENMDCMVERFPKLCSEMRKNPTNYYIFEGNGSYGFGINSADILTPYYDFQTREFSFKRSVVL